MIGQKNTKVFWHQSEARTGLTVWNWSVKTLSPGALLLVLDFSSPEFFFARFRLFPVPTNCPWVSEDGNQQVCAKAIGLNFSSYCACVAFNWVLSIWKNPKIAGFFALLPFLTYLCYTRLKPSTHCVQLRRKIAKIEWTLSK